MLRNGEILRDLVGLWMINDKYYQECDEECDRRADEAVNKYVIQGKIG